LSIYTDYIRVSQVSGNYTVHILVENLAMRENLNLVNEHMISQNNLPTGRFLLEIVTMYDNATSLTNLIK